MDLTPLRTAGSGLRDISKTALNRVAASPITGNIVNGANRAVTAARGLRMPGMPTSLGNVAQNVMASPRVGAAVNGVMGAPAAVMDAARGVQMPASVTEGLASARGFVDSGIDSAKSAVQGMRGGASPLPTIEPNMAPQSVNVPAPAPVAPVAAPAPTMAMRIAEAQSHLEPSSSFLERQSGVSRPLPMNPIPAAMQANIPPIEDFLKTPSGGDPKVASLFKAAPPPMSINPIPASAQTGIPAADSFLKTPSAGMPPPASTATIPPSESFLRTPSAPPLSGAAPVPAPAPNVGTGMRMVNAVTGAVQENMPSKLGALGSAATGAVSFAPHWDAFGTESGLDAGQKAKLMLRDSTRAIGGLVGGAVGGGVGSVVGPVGTVAGGLAGGIAGYEGVDAAGGGLRRGLNWANEKLGGSANYITSTDDDLRNAGFDPNKGVLDMFKGAKAANGSTSAKPAVEPAVEPADIAEFNARMAKVGAPSVGMRALSLGPNVVGPENPYADRELFNSAPASAEMIAATKKNMDTRTGQVAAQDAQSNADMRMIASREAASNMMGQRANTDAQDATLQGLRSPGSNVYGDQNAGRMAMASKLEAERSFGDTQKAQIAATAQAQNAGMRAPDHTAFDQQMKLAEFGLKREEFAQKQGENMQTQDKVSMEQRSKGEADLTSRLSTMFVGADGKPDAARVGDATQKMQAEIGRRIQQAQAVPKNSPHYAEAQQLANEMSKKGVAALDPADHKVLLSQLALRDRMKQTHGRFTPGGAEFVDSDLGEYRVDGVEKNMIGSPTLHMANGGSMRQADTMYTDPSNVMFPDLGHVKTDMYDAALGMRAKGKK